MSIWQVESIFFALVLYNPMLLMNSCNPASPSARIFAGVLAMGKSFLVARFTPLSVAWAESTTATSSSKGEPYSSSVVGCGLADRKRVNIWQRMLEFMICQAGGLADRYLAASGLRSEEHTS